MLCVLVFVGVLGIVGVLSPLFVLGLLGGVGVGIGMLSLLGGGGVSVLGQLGVLGGVGIRVGMFGVLGVIGLLGTLDVPFLTCSAFSACRRNEKQHTIAYVNTVGSVDDSTIGKVERGARSR